MDFSQQTISRTDKHKAMNGLNARCITLMAFVRRNTRAVECASVADLNLIFYHCIAWRQKACCENCCFLLFSSYFVRSTTLEVFYRICLLTTFTCPCALYKMFYHRITLNNSGDGISKICTPCRAGRGENK